MRGVEDQSGGWDLPDPASALRIRAAAIDVWRTFPASDPELPAALLPLDWPQAEAVTVFSTVYDTLGPPSTQRVRSILARHGADSAVLAARYTWTIAGSTVGYR